MADEVMFPGVPADTGWDASPRAVTAFFDTHEAADRARRDLVHAGVQDADVRIADGAATTPEAPHHHGFWEALKGFLVPDDDRHLYAEGLRRGGFAVSVETDSAAYDRVVEILDRDGAVDMEERAADWRAAGWSAPTPAGAGGVASRADQPLFDGPLDTASIEPGSVVPAAPEGERPVTDPVRLAAGAPDTAYAGAAPGLASPADTARDGTAQPGLGQPLPAYGRPRVRSYRGDGPKA